MRQGRTLESFGGFEDYISSEFKFELNQTDLLLNLSTIEDKGLEGLEKLKLTCLALFLQGSTFLPCEEGFQAFSSL